MLILAKRNLSKKFCGFAVWREVLVCTILILSLLLTACGDAALTETPEATPRPSPRLITATPATTASTVPPTTIPPSASVSSSISATANRPTATTTRRPNSPTETPAPTPLVIPTPLNGQTPRPSRAIGGDLFTAVERDLSNFQPYGPSDAVSEQYRALLFDARLFKRNPQTLEWEGHAAQAFKYDDTEKLVAVTLRSDIKWSDGKPITSADYVWTFAQALDPGKSWTEAATYADTIESYTAPDSRTLLIKLRGRYSDPYELANFVEPLPRHVWDGKSWSEADRNPEILKPTVVSGSWKFQEWVKKERVVFTRNEISSVSPPPYLNSLTFLYVPDSRKAVAMLARGEIDFYVPPSDRYLAMKELGKVTVYRWNPATAESSFLGFNFRRSLPAEVTFRRALAALIDRTRLIQDAADSHALAMYSDVPPGNPAYSDNVEKYGGGLEQARLFLRLAGYSWRETDGRLLDKQGQETPELSLIYNQESQERARQADYFKQQLSQLGLNLRIVPMDYLSYSNRLKQAPYNYDLFLGGWKMPFPDVARFGQQIWKNNFSGYNNPELLNLYDKAFHEPDQDARFALLAQIQQLEARDLPYLYLYAQQNYLGALYPINGIEPGPLGTSYNNWYIRQ